MPKRAGGLPLTINLEFHSAAPLYRQLYEKIRAAILSGRLRPGARLPASRTLAAELGVSRPTVKSSFGQLLAEGYLRSKLGAGTFVSDELPDDMLQARAEASGAVRGDARGRSTSRRGLLAGVLAETPFMEDEPWAFRPRLPALDHFPWQAWSRIAARVHRYSPPHALAFGDPAGLAPLREAIAVHVAASRAIRCTAEQVIVTSGGTQAQSLAAQVLLDHDDVAWIEDPADTGARAALLLAGVRLVPVPVDTLGLDVATGRSLRPYVRLAHVTPSHQHVLGVTMSLGRRLELLGWASESGAWILENDYESEYRYSGQPLSALQGLDTEGRVVYSGTFSQVLFPGLRMGYLVVPHDLVDAFRKVRCGVDGHPPILQQAVLAEFMAEGHFDRHLRRMRRLYAGRQAALVRTAREELKGLLEVNPNDSGMHLVGWLPEGLDGAAASRSAREHGVEAPPVSAHALKPRERDGLLLGYAALDEAAIKEGIRRLAASLRKIS